MRINAKPRHSAVRKAAIFLLAVGLLSGCGKSADDYIKRAQTQLDSGNIPAAIIELKNALQKDPKNVSARVMLGQSYLELSDGVSAETDLLKARADGAPAATLAKPLAEAEVLLGKFDNALTESQFPSGASPQLKASLLAVRGMAYLGQGKSAEAKEAFNAGLAEDPNSLDVLVAITRYAVAIQDLPTAHARLEEALKQAPNAPRLVALKGALAFAEHNFPVAEEAFTQLAKAQPWSVGARTDLAQAQIAEGKLKNADTNLDAVLKGASRAPKPNYLRALTAFQEKDYKAARSHIQIVLATVVDNPPALLLGGAISYALGEYEQANSYLGKYVTRVPDDVRGRRLLGAVQIQLGRPGDAVKTLSPAVAASGDDAQILALIGEAAARSGDAASADKYLTMALEKKPDNAAVRTELGLSKISLGQTDAAIEEFERASKLDPNAVGPDAALFATYFRDKDYDKALEIAARLQEKQPTNPLGFDLAGIANYAKGDRDAARTSLGKAKELRSDDPTALRGLAAIALLDGKPDLATQYYETLVQANPKDPQAPIALAQLQLNGGNADAARDTLQKAIDQNPDNATARAALTRLFIAQGKANDALNLVEPALAKQPKQPELLEAAGLARLAAGKADTALDAFKSLVDVLPQASEAHRELAQAYAASRDLGKAVPEAETAVRLAPESKPARLALGTLLVSAKNLDEAQRLADDWAKAAPDDADYAELQGIIASNQGRMPDALQAYERGMKAQDTNLTRTRLSQAQEKAGFIDKAEATLAGWVEAHPDDVLGRTALADFYTRTKKTAQARDQYAEILRQAPKNVAAENNLAWMMSLLGQKEEALEHAKHAASIAPDTPNVLDTLGVILLQNGNAPEARDTLQKAANAAPKAGEIQFHLAQALKETGEVDRAREILRGLLSGSEAFEGRDQAQQLLNQLRG